MLLICLLYSCGNSKRITKVETLKDSDYIYHDVNLYKGVYYYGKQDKVLEISIQDDSINLIIWSVYGNSLTLKEKIEVKSFKANKKFNKLSTLQVKLNDIRYKLIYISENTEQITDIVRDLYSGELEPGQYHSELRITKEEDKEEYIKKYKENKYRYSFEEILYYIGEYRAFDSNNNSFDFTVQFNYGSQKLYINAHDNEIFNEKLGEISSLNIVNIRNKDSHFKRNINESAYDLSMTNINGKVIYWYKNKNVGTYSLTMIY